MDWRSIDESVPASPIEWSSIDEADLPLPPRPAATPEPDRVLRGVIATGPRAYRGRKLLTAGVLAALLNRVVSASIAALAHLCVFILVAGIVVYVRDEADGEIALFAGLHGGGVKGDQDLGEKEKQNQQTESVEKLPTPDQKPVAPQPEVKTEPVPQPGPGPTAEVKPNPVASSKELSGRGGNRKGEMLKKYGGNDASEAAVEAGLKWLAAHQSEKGCWEGEDFAKQCPKDECRDGKATGDEAYTPGVTALAILAFLGAGHSHVEGDYQKTVAKALAWLQELQRRDGGFSRYETINMYNHALCTWALAEAFAYSRDENLRKPAQLAIDYLVKAQYLGGGWDYLYSDDPDDERNDTSIGGWAVMAMKSASLGGLEVPKASFERAARLFDARTDRKTGELVYAERKPGIGRKGDGLVAVGLLCRIYLGLNDSAPLKAAAGRLMRNLPDWKRMKDAEKASAPTGGFSPNVNMYYWYYGTLAMFQVGGEYWDQWNLALRDMLVEHQIREGHRRGSWDPEETYIGREGGRVFSTAINVLNLEIYYRYLPLYSIEEGLAAKLKWNDKTELVERAKNSISNGERMQAMTELAKRKGDPEVTAVLAQMLGDRDPVVRLHAAKLLGERKDKEALKFLEDAIRKEDSPLKGAMLEAVGRIGEKSSIPFLIGYLKDPNDRVVRGAETALKSITQQDLGTDPDAWSKWWVSQRNK